MTDHQDGCPEKESGSMGSQRVTNTRGKKLHGSLCLPMIPSQHEGTSRGTCRGNLQLDMMTRFLVRIS